LQVIHSGMCPASLRARRRRSVSTFYPWLFSLPLVARLRGNTLLQRVGVGGNALRAEVRGGSDQARIAAERPAVSGVVACPKCGASMVKRKAARGANAGNEFWGCSRYPKCRGVRPV